MRSVPDPRTDPTGPPLIAPDQPPQANDRADDPVDRVLSDIDIAADPHEALRQIAALRRALDDRERAQVARALDDGTSLAAIGRALGISRQAIHRRYGDLSAAAKNQPRAPDRPATPVPSELVITPEARLVLRHAIAEAQVTGQPAVDSGHVLLALLRPPTCPVLEAAGITPERARSHILGASVPAGAFARDRDRPDARAFLLAASQQAQVMETDEITPELLLRTALADPDAAAARTLRALGVDPGVVITALD